MKIRFYILLCFFITSNVQSYSQKTFRNKRSKLLSSINIDTLKEEILIIEKTSSIIYFRQSDIFEYLKEKPDSLLLDLLNQKKDKLYFRDFSWENNSTEKEDYYLGDFVKEEKDKLFLALFNEVGADLIFYGEFMVFDKSSEKVVSINLKMKKVKHKLGQIDVHFRLPSGKIFWYVLLRLGK